MPLAVTPLAADAVLGSVAAVLLGGAGWAWSVRRRLSDLPLQLGALVAGGSVDGAATYRFAARLGHGRALQAPEPHVRWEPAGGAAVELPAHVAAQQLCGPFVVQAVDAEGVVRGPGCFRVDLRVRSGGRDWSAHGSFEHGAVKPGRFQPLVVGRSVSFNAGWDQVVPPVEG